VRRLCRVLPLRRVQNHGYRRKRKWTRVLTLLLRMLLYPAPDIRFGTDERAAFDRLNAELKGGRLVPYGLPWPKARFLQDLAVTGDFSVPRIEPAGHRRFRTAEANAVQRRHDEVKSRKRQHGQGD